MNIVTTDSDQNSIVFQRQYDCRKLDLSTVFIGVQVVHLVANVHCKVNYTTNLEVLKCAYRM